MSKDFLRLNIAIDQVKNIELKIGGKNSDFHFVTLTLLTFSCLFETAGGFNYIGPCRWF